MNYSVKVIFSTREPPLPLCGIPLRREKSPPLIDFLPPWGECPKGERGVM
jgi:hypothetical protein